MTDSLTVHYIARELHERWRDRRILGGGVDRDARAIVLCCEGSDPVLFDLRALGVREASDKPRGDLLRGWTVVAVEAPVDERRLVIRCERPGKFRGSASKRGEVEVSFVPNARGAVVRDGKHILATIGTAPGPLAAPRPVLDDSTVSAAVAAGDAETMSRARWMSPRLSRLLMSRPERAAQLYRTILSLPPAAPTRCGSAVFPLALCDGGVPLPSLISAARAESVTLGDGDDRARRALARMRRELQRAREAPRLRAIADALTSLGDQVGLPESVVLADGTTARVPNADAPGATSRSLSEKLYSDARAMERALEILPGRIAALEAKAAAAPGEEGRSSPRKQPGIAPRRLPYKSYRSSGGLEILVGRGAQSNDELTYKIAKPGDVWLHARDVTGAHVVLRWSGEGAPPTRDLHEAAALAAWHSRARGSVVVPVDWTRRRYVKRARGAPGRALVERAKTVMARPSAELERRLRKNEEQGTRK